MIKAKLPSVLTILVCFIGLLTAQSSQKESSDLEALAARGFAIAQQDPEATKLRNEQPNAPARRGFDIGMGVAENDTLPGPGKQRIHDSLPRAEQSGFEVAVSYSLARNRRKLTDLAPRGADLASLDPLASELRNQQPDGDARLGFDIGMAAAEKDTLPGPGKQKMHDSLYPAEQAGFAAAVTFSVDRNRNATLARVGAKIANIDSAVGQLRNARSDAFYRLGFDIATGLFGNPAMGAQGNTLTGPGSLRIRNDLNRAAQTGFDTAVTFFLGPQVDSKWSRSGDPLEKNRKGIPGFPSGPWIEDVRVVSGWHLIVSFKSSQSRYLPELQLSTAPPVFQNGRYTFPLSAANWLFSLTGERFTIEKDPLLAQFEFGKTYYYVITVFNDFPADPKRKIEQFTDSFVMGNAANPPYVCDEARRFALGADGSKYDCKPYKCETGRCMSTCKSVDDCLAPTVCDFSGQCVYPAKN
jgi:hypothetical protein